MSHGHLLRSDIKHRPMTCFIGVHDALSASIAARHFDGLFLSGFSFAASFYGLPDVGFIAWTDMVAYCQRVRTIVPQSHIIVDIDDGYGDAEVAAHVAAMLESVGASGLIMEDQKRPRSCGHVGGKQILELDAYLEKLERVLAVRRDLYIIARTDATDDEERMKRAVAFEQAGADAVLVDGIEDLTLLRRLADRLSCPLMFNQIAGGKSPPCTLTELAALGVSLVNFSTPTLFAAQASIEQAMQDLAQTNGRLSAGAGIVSVASCNTLLKENLVQRYDQAPMPIAGGDELPATDISNPLLK